MTNQAPEKAFRRTPYFALGLLPALVLFAAFLGSASSNKEGMFAKALLGSTMVSVFASWAGAAVGFSFATHEIRRVHAFTAGTLFSVALGCTFYLFPWLMFDGMAGPAAGLFGAWGAAWICGEVFGSSRSAA